MRRKQWTLIFKALGNENRLKILQFLWGGEVVTVTAIANHIGVSLKVASQHLAILSRLRLVEGEGRRAHVYYRLSSVFPKEVRFIVGHYLRNLS